MPTMPNCLYEKEIFKSKSMFMFVLHCRSMLHFSHCVSPRDSARMCVSKRLRCMSASCSADHRRPPAAFSKLRRTAGVTGHMRGQPSCLTPFLEIVHWGCGGFISAKPAERRHRKKLVRTCCFLEDVLSFAIKEESVDSHRSCALLKLNTRSSSSFLGLSGRVL